MDGDNFVRIYRSCVSQVCIVDVRGVGWTTIVIYACDWPYETGVSDAIERLGLLSMYIFCRGNVLTVPFNIFFIDVHRN